MSSQETSPPLNRAQFEHLSDSQFDTACALAVVFGPEALAVMLTEDRAVHIARLEHLSHYVDMRAQPAIKAAEKVARREIEKALKSAQEAQDKAQADIDAANAAAKQAIEESQQSAMRQMRDIQRQAEAQLRQATAAVSQATQASGATRVEISKPIKITFGKYAGHEGENLRRWILEVEQANAAALYTEDSVQIANAISHLAGTARDWAFTCIDQAKSQGREAFPTWSDFKSQLFLSFHGEHARHNDRARFLACKQRKLSVFDYVQSLRQLSAAVLGDPLSETTKITVLREGLALGPVRTELFRTDPSTFEEACRIVLKEDASLRRAANLPLSAGTSSSSAASGPSPMDLSYTELSQDRQLSNIRCFRCNRRGHYATRCRNRAVKSRNSQERQSGGSSHPLPGNGNAH